MSPSSRTARAGFTLIELIMTIAIMAILLGVLAPGALRFVKDVRLAGQANDLITSFMLARSEAVKRDIPITLCGRPNNVNNPKDCGSDPKWEDGWVIVIDADANRQADNPAATPLKTEGPLTGGNTLKASGPGPKGAVTFGPTGIALSGALTLTLCDDEGYGRIIDISPLGRASSTKVTPQTANADACKKNT